MVIYSGELTSLPTRLIYDSTGWALDLTKLRSLRTASLVFNIPLVVCLLLSACSPPPATIPPIEKLFPTEPRPADVLPAGQFVDFSLDGTLSMRGFSHPTDGKFAQLLQDLDLSFSNNWARNHIRYHRFGSIIEDIRQQPFYVPASQESFFQGNKNYVATRIDNVFRKSTRGNITVVMTDLFQQDLDIASIQEALTSAAFPSGASLAVWQWELPFSGPIYDFDFRTSQGHPYTGQRPIYLLAAGPEKSLAMLARAISAAVTIGKPQFLMLSSHVASNAQEWLTVTRTESLGLVRRSAEYTVYRPSSGCRSAALNAASQLTPVDSGAIARFTPHTGSYQAELFSIAGPNGAQSAHLLTNPQVESSTAPKLTVQMDCASLNSSPLDLLRIRRIGTPEDIVLPGWVEKSSANSMDLNAAFQTHQPAWGDKTLNLSPLLRGLASKAVDGTVIASAYFYFVKN